MSEDERPHLGMDDPSALVHAATSARANMEPPDLVKYTNALADALGVSRQVMLSLAEHNSAIFE